MLFLVALRELRDSRLQLGDIAPAIDDGRRVSDTRDREEKINLVADLFDLGQLMLQAKAIRL